MKFRVSTETLNRLKRFRKNKRAFWSLEVLVVAYLLSLTSPWTVNDEPLVLRYERQDVFPGVRAVQRCGFWRGIPDGSGLQQAF